MITLHIDKPIFKSDARTIVNTVNCVGVMGKGIALECKNRYPKLFEDYVEKCKQKEIKIGSLWMYQQDSDYHILNFPTKEHWRDNSKQEFIMHGLDSFTKSYEKFECHSVSFPLLGASNGKLEPHWVLIVMVYYLKKVNIPVGIFISQKQLNQIIKNMDFHEFIKNNNIIINR